MLQLLYWTFALNKCKKFLLANSEWWLDVGKVYRTLLEHSTKLTYNRENFTKNVNGAYFL